VPTIGDLDRVGQRLCRCLTVVAATVARLDWSAWCHVDCWSRVLSIIKPTEAILTQRDS
jgi:hypothetical protein